MSSSSDAGKEHSTSGSAPVCLEVAAAMQYAVDTVTYTRDSVVLPAGRRQP